MLSDAEEEINVDDGLPRTQPIQCNSNLLVFQPIFNFFVWKDPESKDQKISIAILLSTIIGENPGDLTL